MKLINLFFFVNNNERKKKNFTIKRSKTPVKRNKSLSSSKINEIGGSRVYL